MNMNYNYLTTIFRSILTQIHVFLVLITIFHFDLEKFISKIVNIVNVTGPLTPHVYFWSYIYNVRANDGLRLVYGHAPGVVKRH